MMLGGSGSLIPLPEIALQCLFAGLTAAWIWLRPADIRNIPRGAWIISALLLAVPLLQLLPLPPVLWQSLPGRSTEKAALELVGEGSSWQPLSLTANRTLASLLAMAPAAVVLVMAAAQNLKGRTILLGTMAAVALFSVLVGAAQLSGGAGNRFRFYNPDEPFLDGFQTNHNAEADVLLMGMVALAAIAAEFAAVETAAADLAGAPQFSAMELRGSGMETRVPAMASRRRPAPRLRKRPIIRGPQLGMVGAASALLLLGVVLTASRTGIALLPAAIGAQLLILRRWLPIPTRRGTALAVANLAAAILALSGLAALELGALHQHGALARVWERFHSQVELRPEIWRDSLFAMRQYWPWGAGMGSFIPVFAAAERLEVVTGQFVNRAHNDYLEFLIEAGLPGSIAFGLICRQVTRDAWRGWRARIAGSEAQLICGAANLLIVSLHSLGDYPLRTISIACMIAVSVGLLLPVRDRAKLGNGI